MMRRRMKLRSSSNAFVWASLPAEIRLMILETFADQKHPGWASFASVCREWQLVLEKINFYKIKLRASCLDDFQSTISPQKRELIHHIYLNVELPQYTYKCCSKQRSPPVKIDPIVSDAISKLFTILSTWGQSDNLALELNVYSPSDNEHWFRNIYLPSDDVNHDEAAIPDVCTGTPNSDLRHGWMHGQQVRAPPIFAIRRLFEHISLKCQEGLPQVKAVTHFIIRRQFRRCISPWGLAVIFSKLDRLEHITWEPWAPYNAWMKVLKDRDHSYAMEYFPDTLNSLIMFEDSYKFYEPFPRQADDYGNWFIPMADSSKNIGAVLASKSLSLQRLAISLLVNAEEIFRRCRSTWTWPHLQSLALTSQLLQDDIEKHGNIEFLLCRAGALVQQMPKIHTFVLWNGGKAHACAFIYRIDNGSASITWRGTWLLTLAPRVVKSWRLADAKLRASRPDLQLKQEHICAVMRSPGDAIYHLKLPCQVIDPASLWQIRRER